jgi:CDGSH-type Zn-finger protein
MADANVTITARPNGPLRVEGPIRLIDVDGTEINLEGKPAVSLCRCGASTKKPFCDGTHSKIGFQAAEAAVAAEQRTAEQRSAEQRAAEQKQVP